MPDDHGEAEPERVDKSRLSPWSPAESLCTGRYLRRHLRSLRSHTPSPPPGRLRWHARRRTFCSSISSTASSLLTPVGSVHSLAGSGSSESMQPRNTQPRHLDNVDAPASPGSSGRCSCRITGAEQGRLVRVSILGLSNGGARPPEAAHPPPTPPLGPVVLRQSRQESGGELGQLKKARRGGAKAGALHPARGRPASPHH